ncbi:MAG: hypothetical protein DSZ32_07340 [Gammaproteobacteria bacterium]|nr:MAG: hypothetical protein DSZ32_07340 [Gammaproteobacteria bacterium]
MTGLMQTNNIPQVAMAFMNDVHAEEAELVNRLNELIEQHKKDPSVEAEIDQAMMEWIEHTVAHFERENRLMQETGFPAYSIHAEEHDRALAALNLLHKNWREQRDIVVLAEYVQINWPQWFHDHISTMDTVTALFFQQSGLTV